MQCLCRSLVQGKVHSSSSIDLLELYFQLQCHRAHAERLIKKQQTSYSNEHDQCFASRPRYQIKEKVKDAQAAMREKKEQSKYEMVRSDKHCPQPADFCHQGLGESHLHYCCFHHLSWDNPSQAAITTADWSPHPKHDCRGKGQMNLDKHRFN